MLWRRPADRFGKFDFHMPKLVLGKTRAGGESSSAFTLGMEGFALHANTHHLFTQTDMTQRLYDGVAGVLLFFGTLFAALGLFVSVGGIDTPSLCIFRQSQWRHAGNSRMPCKRR